MSVVRLANGLVFPAAELATKVTGAFGIRGSGKSSLMSLVCEQLLDAKIQVIVVDPVGVHYALRLAPNGRSPSAYQIPVLGGRHGDLALAPTAGAVVGEALARSNDSCVLDISSMRKGERIRFAAALFEAFYEGKKENPSPVLVCLEEAQSFAPQIMYKGSGQEQMLGAIEDLASQGRNFGAGLWLNSLRPQKINKEITSLMDLVFGFRLTGVHERKAVRDWLQEKGAEGRAEIDGELPSLQAGHAFVWSPAVFDIFGKFHMRQKTTYDAGATPLSARAKVKLRPLDLNELEAQMAQVVTEAKANDPRALKARIVELQKELLANTAALIGRGERVRTIVEERSVLKPEHIIRVEKLVDRLAKQRGAMAAVVETQATRVREAEDKVAVAVSNLALQVNQAKPGAPPPVSPRGPLRMRPLNGISEATRKLPKEHPAAGLVPATTAALSKCARALLDVVVQRGVATASQVAALSGYRKTSSSFSQGLSMLRVRGLITGSGARIEPTQEGRDTIGPTTPLPKGAALLDYWLPRLSKCEGTLLREVYNARSVSRADLGERTGYSTTSSSFSQGLSGLRVLDLIYGETGGDVQIADVFNE